MIIKNLTRRKGRTLLTVLGISIGVFAIILLGALANGLEGGYNSLITGSKADLVVNQPNVIDVSMAGIDQDLIPQLQAMSEVQTVSGMTQGIVTADESPFFFVFGYPEDSFILDRFQIVAGDGLDSREAQTARGKPLVLGITASEALNKEVGDTLRLTNTAYRIIGIYETGSSFEDGGAVIPLSEAQLLLGRQRQVNVIYLQLKDPSLSSRVIDRADRLWPHLDVTTTGEFADKQILGDAMQVYVIVIAGMAIVIGGVGMANSQLMSIYERTREIGVLRAVGWPRKRILTMILGESVIVGLLGGVLGFILGFLTLSTLSISLVAMGASADSIDSKLIFNAFGTVTVLGVVGGIFPAWRASHLRPIEALRYEGGSAGSSQKRFPFGGMAVQSLYQRKTRTLLTLGMIAITISSVMTMEAFIGSAKDMVGGLATGSGAEIMLRQANLSDTSQSVIDEHVLDRITILPEVESTSGLVFTAVSMPETLFFVVQGLEPNNFGIRRFTIIEGETLKSNHQIIIGRTAADALNKSPGETIEIGGSRFKIVGVYDTGVQWESMGGVVSLRDGQVLAGRPRKVSMASVKLINPESAQEVIDKINTNFEDVHASMSGEFAENLPDMENANSILGALSFMAILIGGIGIMNTMLMAVLERTREIGALRALGWRQREVLTLILKEALLLGLIGGAVAIPLAQLLIFSISNLSVAQDVITLSITWQIYLRAMLVAILLGLIGGIYPALRATRLQPVEALRYE